MKISSIKLSSFVILLSLSFGSLAQKEFQGKAVYQSKTTLDMNNFGRPGMSEDLKKRIADRMKSTLEKTYILNFNQLESVYKEEEVLEAPMQGQGGMFRMMMSNLSGGDQYKNVKEQIFLQEQEIFGKQFLIKDSLPLLKWKMEGETKQIGQYMCFKATAIKTKKGLDFTNFRRPNPESKTDLDSTKTKTASIEKKESIEMEVIAWYTPQIPINQGPGEYWGLPGLILEVNEDRTTILCSKIIMNPKEKEIIKAPTKGKEVTKKEFDAILKEKTEEMRKNFRNRRGNRGSSRG